jgi:hypothetical protein
MADLIAIGYPDEATAAAAGEARSGGRRVQRPRANGEVPRRPGPAGHAL